VLRCDGSRHPCSVLRCDVGVLRCDGSRHPCSVLRCDVGVRKCDGSRHPCSVLRCDVGVLRCDGSRHPWQISASRGQRINLTLYDFTVDEPPTLYDIHTRALSASCFSHLRTPSQRYCSSRKAAGFDILYIS